MTLDMRECSRTYFVKHQQLPPEITARVAVFAFLGIKFVPSIILSTGEAHPACWHEIYIVRDSVGLPPR